MRPVAHLRLFILMLCVAYGIPAAAEPALQYEMAEAKTGRVLSTAWGWTEPTDNAPHTVTVTSRTVFTRGSEWLVRAVFTADKPPRCVSWEETVRRKDGAVMSTHQVKWGPELFPFLSGPFPADAYPLEVPLGYVIGHLGLGTQSTASFHTVLIDTLPQFDLWLDGKETVRVPAGEFDCHRVRMRANAQSLFPKLPSFVRPFLSFFIPTYTLWLTVNEPQLLVQYSGQLGPPGSPELLVRLLKVSDTHPQFRDQSPTQ
jgi:hypothetical protein